MTVLRDSNPATFLQHAGSFLYANEAEYSLPLGLVEALQTYLKPEITPLLLRVVESEVTTAVCVQTRPESVMVSRLDSQQAAALALYLREHNLALAGASGPIPGVQDLLTHYSSAPFHARMSNRILQLTRVIPPSPAAGQLRIATRADFDIACRFFRDFHLECLPKELPSEAQLATLVEDRIARKTVFLWEKENRPVSSAHTTRPTRNGISIGPVYTPPSERGRGYASTLMATLSQQLLEGGKAFCVLLTDTNNPTSNRIYETIGYRLIGTSAYLHYE